MRQPVRRHPVIRSLATSGTSEMTARTRMTNTAAMPHMRMPRPVRTPWSLVLPTKPGTATALQDHRRQRSRQHFQVTAPFGGCGMSDNARLEDLRRRIENDPASIAFAQLAEECRRLGRHQEAIDICRRGLTRHPGYLSARVTLGRSLLHLGQLDEAQQELEIVLQGAAQNLAALRALGDVYRRRGDIPESDCAVPGGDAAGSKRSRAGTGDR